MSRMRGSRIWALVVDGRHARILRGLEDGDGEPPVERVIRAKSTHLRDVLEDKPGRSFSSGAAGRRSAMEPPNDPVLDDMKDFAD